MIVFDLECIHGHTFEGWFDDKQDLETQQEYWQLPDGSFFDNSNFADLRNGRLMFIVFSTDYQLGAIAGVI